MLAPPTSHPQRGIYRVPPCSPKRRLGQPSSMDGHTDTWHMAVDPRLSLHMQPDIVDNGPPIPNQAVHNTRSRRASHLSRAPSFPVSQDSLLG